MIRITMISGPSKRLADLKAALDVADRDGRDRAQRLALADVRARRPWVGIASPVKLPQQRMQGPRR